jgi:hypothetical protein
MTGCAGDGGTKVSSLLHDVRAVELLIVRARTNIHNWMVFIVLVFIAIVFLATKLSIFLQITL